MMTVYHSFEQEQLWGGRIFVHAHTNAYTLVAPITRMIRDMEADQPVERAATLEDIRAEVLTPDRLNTLVFGVFAAVALAIAVIGVAGVLAFSVSGRTREFGIRLALGAQPRKILSSVLLEGTLIAGIGVAAGVAVGFALSRLIGSYVAELRLPEALPLMVSAAVILAAAVIASVLPAARAAGVDTVQALRAD
jgi:ABC-type antimicrobial peptide transport system permease subunit